MDKTTILRIEVQGFGEAKQDLEFLTTETDKLAQSKRLLRQESVAAAKSINAEAGSIAQLRADTALLRQQANNMRAVTQQEIAARDKLIKKIYENNVAIRDYDRSMSGSNALVGEYSRGINASAKGIGTAIAGMAAGFAAAGGAIKLFTGIMNSADSSGTALEATMAAAKGGLDNFFKSMATGDWSSFLGNMKEAIRAGREFVLVMDGLEDKNRAFKIEEADLKVRMADLEMTIKDESDKSAEAYQKRTAAAEEYLRLAKEQGVKKQALADEEFAAYSKKMSGVSQLTEEQLDAFIRQDEATQDLMGIGRQYLALTKEMNKAANNSMVDAYADARARRDALGTGAKAYAEAVRDYDKLTDKEKDIFLDLYEKKKEAEYSWYTENKRIYTQYGTLLSKTNILGEQEVKVTQKKVEEYAKLREEIEKYAFVYARALRDIEYRFDPDAITEAISEPLFSDEEWETGMAKSREAFIKQQDERNERMAEYRKADEDAEADSQQKKKDIAVAALNGVDMAAQSIFANKRDRLNAEMQAELNAENLTEQQRAEIKKKYAREQQKNDIKQAFINAALGITKTFVEYGFTPAGWVAAAALAVQSAIQIGIIKAQKFASGGRIKGGARIKPDSRGDDTLIIAKQGEVILNQRQQLALGAGSLKRAGVPGFAGGGIVGGITPSAGYGADMGAFVDRLIAGINDQRVQLVLPELNQAQKRLDLITKSGSL
ncbi:MAG: hypothetical protein UW18_C0019G0004 [Microgenomates group bacterium GW2011_GWF1_44_10]|nr:MAG: hypothetical protein UW18_C0019G0004 [Microgenomates group bacterium GW2011_GWF1_44_10]